MPDTERLQRRALDQAFAAVAGQVVDGTVPFAVLGVADSVGTIRLEAFAPDGAPGVGTDAICAIASITKPIVATSVMQLVEAGRFQLDEPLRTWLPELDATGRRPFSAWHVLSHTSGLEDVDVGPLLATGAGREALLRAAFAAEQPAAPGTRHRYVSTPFDLLAEAVSRAVGTPFDVLLRDGVTAAGHARHDLRSAPGPRGPRGARRSGRPAGPRRPGRPTSSRGAPVHGSALAGGGCGAPHRTCSGSGAPSSGAGSWTARASCHLRSWS
jgi:CubicO group peptidase (beta-lactamase class C family)